MEKETVIVLGASPNPSRVAYQAIERLTYEGYNVIPIGIKPGVIAGKAIVQGRPVIEDVLTVSIYLRAGIQKEYYDYIKELAPKRLIFNPGAENKELMTIAREEGIEVEAACTLVMLSLGSF